MQITILGKRWKFERVGKVDTRNNLGHCDGPKQVNKTIRVLKRLRGRIELEVIIHELLHAGDWYKDEEWVQQIAEDMALILHDRLGYRRGGRTHKK